ncbi:glutamate-ammonia-ligase adenylyltransferase [Rhodovulum iodosum]|uniref:Glutamate-ammonia-ligase adenylyltransferase n=1 Tax=Rhodovulum iodosum TaxID=68291 RepID=A0ABV3XPK7_9RHOB|nr:glutamine-synthetase adenylyltransferase [Rhodovulum robiginosum]RSK35852.1 glutamine-synthetase adenylyltransferase [Rhodovulum robiginosum]
MTFAAHLTRAPIPYEPDRAAEAAERFAGQPPEVRALLEGTAGCSPYLWGLMTREDGWMEEALAGAPDTAFDALLAEVGDLPLDALKPGLRQAKRRAALLIALADLGGVWPLERATAALTEFADLCVDTALKRLVAAEIGRGKIPGLTEDDAATAGGMVALAMGKQGAHELNYSSDIDLICLFDQDRFDAADFHEARAAFVKITRRMTALLSELTGEGYVFRTDLRLRPDASVTPVCVAMEAAERYYESLGRTWERAAHIKARPCAGDIAAGEAYLERLRPFVWRKHLDFAAIQDAHDMRLKIRSHKGLHGAIALEGHDMKLGAGGIREIEFFTQTRQLIAGGRDPDLRVRGTVEGLARLAGKDWVPADVARTLTADYREHREIEHRLQMVNDAQTHALPGTAHGMDRIARFMGEGDTAAWRARLTERLGRVAALTEGFFAPGTPRKDEAPELPDSAACIVERWAGYPCLRSARAREIFGRLRADLLRRLTAAPRPAEAFAAFDGFLAGLPAGVQLFSLFEANPHLIDLIIDIATLSPELAQYLSRNAGVLDAVIGGDFFAPWPGKARLSEELTARLAAIDDYERQLDAARRWAKEWHFRIGVHFLRGLIPAEVAGAEYADLAEAVLSALWGPVVAQFSAKHGAPPGKGAVMLGMGSLGAGRLTATSDLDLIVIYDADGVEASDGRRPLAARAYYARLTQALVTALTAAMAEGKLYEVDMRLRPSGRQGPVATSLQSFRAYQRDEAWTWEHLALTRARPVAGEAALGDEVEALRRALLCEKADAARVVEGVVDMRARLAEAKPAKDTWDGKQGPGRGQDIELIASAAALVAASPATQVAGQIEAGQAAGWLSADEGETLCAGYALTRKVQAAARLISPGPLNPDELGEAGLAFLLRGTGAQSAAELQERLTEARAAAARVIEAILARGATGGGDAA